MLILFLERKVFVEQMLVEILRDREIRSEEDFGFVVHKHAEFLKILFFDAGCVAENVSILIYKLRSFLYWI